MPEESKKNQHKERNEAKDQRKPRQARRQGGSHDKKYEKKSQEPRVSAPQKPVYEEPGPEFYQNLKRETDEILKITEEANTKYKKKEIQSNWAKYEMPIESYDEIEEQENMGADYEKLIEAPLSLGGHFQFKHEKSWDAETGPSPYDKYFDINMDNLFVSVSTVPFHERIAIDKTIFSETDILCMNNRATRFKQKYYNDKTFTTPELQMQDNIIKLVTENMEKVDRNETIDENERDQNEIVQEQEQEDNKISNENLTKQIKGLAVNDSKTKISNKIEEIKHVSTRNELESETSIPVALSAKESVINKDPESFDDLILEDQIKKPQDSEGAQKMEIPDIKEMLEVTSELQKPKEDPQKTPVIESPEDLEKWLDDFLDG